jgi:ABC-2 type transport system permease protein
LRTEEKRGRLEPIIATSVSRKTIFGCFILIAVLEAIALTFLGVLGLYAAASSTGLIALGTLTKAAFAYLPALFVMIGLATFFVGLLPKLKSLVWLLFGYSFIMFYFGRLFKVPEIAIKLTPFGNIPQLPIEQFSVLPLVVLCVIAVGLTVVGVWGFERRDIKN